MRVLKEFAVDTAKKCVVCLVLVAGALQWSILGERLVAALWAWYRFSAPYGGGGHITVGVNAQVAFYVLSAILLAIAAWAMPAQPRWRTAGRFSILFIGGGVAVWTAVLLSPLARFTH
jgi:hypothetical protein